MRTTVVIATQMVAVVAAIVAFHAVVVATALRETLLQYRGGSAEHLSSGEGFLLGLLLTFGLGAAFALSAAFARWGVADRILHGRSQRWPAALALIAALGAWACTRFVLRGAPLTDDERTCLFEAHCLLRGSLAPLAPQPVDAFQHQFVVLASGGRWAGLFPVGQPLLLALGTLLGTPYLTQWLACASIVWNGARFAQDAWDDQTAVLTALLLTTSPALIMTSGTLHNVVPAVAFGLVALRATFAIVRGGSSALGLLLGAASGCVLLCRPLDGVLVGLSCAAWIGFARRDRLAALGLAVLGGLPLLFVHLLSYRTITGAWLRSPYLLWIERDWPGTVLFGFGRTIWGRMHTPAVAVSKTFAAWARTGSWAFGWPAVSFVFALMAIPLSKRDPLVRLLLAWIALHSAAYFFYCFGSTHDLGSYYHLYALPALALLTARVAVLGRGRRLSPSFAIACTVVGLATFWPFQLARLSRVAAGVRAPIEAAARLPAPALVFYSEIMPSTGVDPTSWVFYSPIVEPDDRVWWSRAASPELAREVLRAHPERHAYRLEWQGDRPVFVPL